ncbi:hypothetical protein [Bradyrhizobium sp. Ash2021]|uniref:hypothetical protein n=1 Tax=Bradyrhizobium sp. Ash2021 TaxID=2954771 RepID=UPI0028169F11|nr:hypothetical protein [Bradyrhizobium sp. Ash2021]WMT79505.1 hypothetical protein NL528_46500 [Bradyrhizobium sp. Ash2021]
MSSKTMARRPPAQRGWMDRRRKAPQMDLFASGQSSGVIGAPAWLQLPTEVQRTLTRLIAQLILEHADKSKSAAMTEVGHDL